MQIPSNNSTKCTKQIHQRRIINISFLFKKLQTTFHRSLQTVLPIAPSGRIRGESPVSAKSKKSNVPDIVSTILRFKQPSRTIASQLRRSSAKRARPDSQLREQRSSDIHPAGWLPPANQSKPRRPDSADSTAGKRQSTLVLPLSNPHASVQSIRR